MFSWLIKNKSHCPLNVLLVVRKRSSPRKLCRGFVTNGPKPGKSFLSTMSPWWSIFDMGPSLQGVDDHSYSWRFSFPLCGRGPWVSDSGSFKKAYIIFSIFSHFCFLFRLMEKCKCRFGYQDVSTTPGGKESFLCNLAGLRWPLLTSWVFLMKY